MRRCLAVLALAVWAALAVSSAAFAVQPGEVLPDPALEKRARAISAELRCLVCQNQSIDDSDAPLAGDLRRLVRERITAHDNDQQVLDYIVARYGEFVLLKPRFELSTLLLWLTPVLVLLAGIALMIRATRPDPRAARRSPSRKKPSLTRSLQLRTRTSSAAAAWRQITNS
ncbi:MAG TPA: cytochrome c-type biogenesis protein CcmH [Hyphomicrobium sp.]|nr:cytochrome c-type biogenesis protein CcmH [Hyphomicrobium sp.]